MNMAIPDQAPNRNWVYLVFGCLAVILLLGCCLTIPCGCCGFFTYLGSNQSPDVQLRATAPDTVRAGEPFDMRVTVVNDTGGDDVLILALQALENGTLELVSVQPIPDVNQSSSFQVNLSYLRIGAGESQTITLRLRATGQGDMPIMVRGNVGLLKGRTTIVTISVRP